MTEYIKSHMARHKVPQYIEFTDHFPLNAAGKVLKYKMREEAAERLGLVGAAGIDTAGNLKKSKPPAEPVVCTTPSRR